MLFKSSGCTSVVVSVFPDDSLSGPRSWQISIPTYLLQEPYKVWALRCLGTTRTLLKTFGRVSHRFVNVEWYKRRTILKCAPTFSLVAHFI